MSSQGKRINIAIAGLGNCASSLIQGIYYYKNPDRLENSIGLMHKEMCGYRPEHIQVVAVFDIDRRKVGKDLSEAIFALPNCTKQFFQDIPSTGVVVNMGKVLDGVSSHMNEYHEKYRFQVSEEKELEKQDIVSILKQKNVDVLLNYLPVGSEMATRFYAECALDAGVGFINNIPVFIASDPIWGDKFKAKNLPILGDDIKSQLGATIVHRTLTDLFKKRGVKLERTYQLNMGGNTDFLNMLNRHRLKSKKISKTEAVQAVAAKRIDDENIHIGPSDYVPWLKDNKICFIRMEGKLFGDVPMNIELRLSVEDSPNSAGVVIDAIRGAKIALDRGIGGPLLGPSSYFFKHPPVQYTDNEAYEKVEEFISEK